jgi:hypothetical protein
LVYNLVLPHFVFHGYWYLQDDEENEEEGGLSKSGKELKKLLGRAAGLNESDADEDEEDEDVLILLEIEYFNISFCTKVVDVRMLCWICGHTRRDQGQHVRQRP